MENGNGESHVDAEVEQEPNGSGHQSDGNNDSQAAKALTPRTLFGGSATLLKEADLNSLKTSAPEQIEEASTAKEDEAATHDEAGPMEVDAQQEATSSEAPADQDEPVEEAHVPEEEIVARPEEEELDVEPDVPEVEPVVEEPEQEPVEKTPETSRRSSRRQTKTPAQEKQTEPVKKTPATGGRSSRRQAKAVTPEQEEQAEEAKEEVVEKSTPTNKRSSRRQATKPQEQTNEEPAAKEEVSTSSRSLRNRQSAQAEKVPTPAKTPATSSRRSAKKPEPVTHEESEVKTPATKRGSRSQAQKDEEPVVETKTPTSSRSTRARKPSEKAAASKASPNESTPAKSSRRSGAKKAEPVKEESEHEEDEEPKTEQSKRSRRSTAGKKKVTEEESADEAPKASSSKKSATPRSRKGKKATDVPVNTDPADPFNFDMQSHNHPEPLGNIKVHKSNFGEMKFTRSPISKDIANRYANTEKAAAKNLSPIVPKPITTAARPISIMELSTTPDVQAEFQPTSSKSTKGRKRNQKSTSADVFEPPVEKTPRSIKRGGATPAKTPKVIVKPEPKDLSPEEQVDADFTEEPHPVGTRLYALWGNDFYPAFVFNERDGLGRYKVIYAEDGATRDIPLTGIIGLSKIQVGSEVAVTKQEGVLQVVRITRVPSKDEPTEWKEGIYDVEEVDEDGQVNQVVASHSWKDFFITKLQQKDIVGSVLNQSVIVDSSNAVARSARRSRLAAASGISEAIHPNARHSTASAKKLQETSDSDTKTTPVKRAPPQKRGRKSETSNANGSDSGTPAKRRLVEKSKVETKEDPKEENEEMEVEENDPNVNNNLFENCMFILTSSARKTNAANFNKREYKELVEKFGGVIVEDTSELDEKKEGDKAFLIADGYYRTQKYLFALASSLPCVHFTWLNACVENNNLVDHEPYLLKAGCSVVDNEEYPWAPLKGKLFKDKTIWVYAANLEPSSHVVQFAEIWRPLLTLLGANVITCDKTDIDEIVGFCKETDFQFLLTDRTCDDRVLAAVEEKDNASAVSSNWIIHAIIVNDLVPVDQHSSFSPQE